MQLTPDIQCLHILKCGVVWRSVPAPGHTTQPARPVCEQKFRVPIASHPCSQLVPIKPHACMSCAEDQSAAWILVIGTPKPWLTRSGRRISWRQDQIIEM